MLSPKLAHASRIEMASRANTAAPRGVDQPSRWTRLWQTIKRELSQSNVFSSHSSSGDVSMSAPVDSLSFPPVTVSPRRHLTGPRRRTLTFRGERSIDNSSAFGLRDDDEDDGQPLSCVVVDGDFGIKDVPDHLSSHHASSIHAGEEVATGSRYASSRAPLTGKVWNGFRSTFQSILYFFDMRFADKDKEKMYQKEQYHSRRQLGLAAAFFFIVLWVLICALDPQPWAKFDYYAFVGIYGFFTLPVLPMIFFNVPYRMPWLWQVWLGFAAWSLPDLGVVQIHSCYFLYADSQCDTQSDFVVFASAIGQPTLAIMALGQNRLVALVGMVQFFILIGAFFFGPGAPNDIFRDAIYYLVYHIFILISTFITEKSSREHFELRDQLKLQYKATQRAQVMEKKASDLTKRFVSYIFHEVRVPLNTALLSLQNLEGEHLFDGFSEDQCDMVHGLTGSLSMMEKVLNDVLSFNRMESGAFTQAKDAFDFHKSIQLTALSHSSPAHMKNIQLETILDPKIDGLHSLFLGDEMRLRQITSNLVSNSLKFTPTGGTVNLVTKLISSNTNSETDAEKGATQFDPERGNAEVETSRQGGPHVIVRVEVTDNGVGLRKRDVVGERLFSPYVQTEVGRRQGGKGTGLGLALVRQIVQLSGGRLGVDSQHGKGSTFWFELLYPLVPPSNETEEGVDRSHLSNGIKDMEKDSVKLEPLAIETARKTAMPESGATAQASPHDRATDESDNSDSTTLLSAGMSSATSKGSQAVSHGSSPTETSTQRVSIDDHPKAPVPSHAAAKSSLPSAESSPASPITSSTTVPADLLLNTVPASSAESEPPPNEQPQSMDILVVDDDKLTRMMMSRMLKRLGHKVQTAENGQEALTKIKVALDKEVESTPIDLVFLDNQMPLMTGVEVAFQVRELGSNLFIVGCTGNALKPDQDEYLEAGADRILTKPIKQKGVEECIVAARTRLQTEGKTKVP